MKQKDNVECVDICVYYMFYSISYDKMSSLSKFIKKINPLYVFYILILLCILIIRIFFLPTKKTETIPVTEEEIFIETGSKEEISDKIALKDNILDVNKTTCAFTDLWDFKYIDIYSWEIRNPEYDYDLYTKKFKVNWHFEEAYLCAVTNVVEKVRLPWTTYYLYVIFGNEEYGGVVKVGKVHNWNYYDYNTSTKYTEDELNWRMYWEELQKEDKSYWLDLKKGFFVADNDTNVRPIKPINKLNSDYPYVNIGWKLSNWTDWIIKKFRIFYKWGEIEPN